MKEALAPLAVILTLALIYFIGDTDISPRQAFFLGMIYQNLMLSFFRPWEKERKDKDHDG